MQSTVVWKRNKKRFFSVLFIVFTLLLFAEDENDIIIGETKNKEADKTEIQSKEKTEDNSSLDLAVNEKPRTASGGLLRLVGALIVICILAYIILKFLKKSTKVFGVDDPYLKTVASMNIAQNKSVHVISLGEKAYIIGVTDSSINLIGEVEDKNLIDAMNLEAERKSNLPKKDFASVFSQFFPKLKQDDKLVGKEFFELQRQRINKASQLQQEEEE